MRILQLKLKNFRPFESVDLDLNADGLIGIRGLNGAGKSSLFAAVEWALFGQRRGAGSVPPKRTGTPSGERNSSSRWIHSGSSGASTSVSIPN